MEVRKKQISIKLGDSRFKVIDLTEPLSEETEVFPGDPKPKKRVISSFQKGNCLHMVTSVGDHNFHPHGDAPNHQNPQYRDRGFEFWGLDYAFNSACMIDLAESKDAVEAGGNRFLKRVTIKHLLPYSEKIGLAGALILRTGYDRWLESNKKHSKDNIPYLEESAIEFISKFKNLRVIGTDSLTIDKVGANAAHRRFKDKLIVECLVNLHRIPRSHRMKFYLQTSPIAVVGATGGPVLAYAYLPLVNHGIKKG